MTERTFVHLHLHTSYSMLDGACRIPDLMEAARKARMPAVAMTDHGVMYGAVEFFKAAMAAGVKPLIGCEVYEASGSMLDRRPDSGKGSYFHLVLLAENNVGYHNLVNLVTESHLNGFYYKPRIDMAALARHSKGLIGLSACLKGKVAERLAGGDLKSALAAAGEYSDILGKGNFFLELQDHGIPDQRKVNAGLLEIAKKTGLPMVATNDVHYLEKEHARAHEILLCIQTKTVLSDPKHLKYEPQEFYLKSPAEMARLFGEAPGAIENTVEIAQRCNVTFDFKTSHFPEFKVPEGHTSKSYLVKLCKAGLAERYGFDDLDHPGNSRERELADRLNYEIGVIESTGFIGYFLVVWDFIRFARERGIPLGPGRGSGSGSLVSYTLGITGFDPLRYNLVFERFLNPERVSPPDFDIDFCQARRGEVIDYVRRKYGKENVANIITFGSLGAKTVIRDVGRVLEADLAYCDRLAKMIPDIPKITLKKAFEESPDFKRAYDTEDKARTIVDYAKVLEGLSRHAGLHAAGIVIADQPLVNFLPLAREQGGEIVTQFSKNHVEAIGMLKADFLGLQTLTVMRETCELIKSGKGIELDVNKLPMDDKETFDLFKRGDTIGVFQLESRGMRDLFRRFAPDRIEDVIALIALYRPGPMQFLDEYVGRKQGKITITYDHPKLEPILKETHGIMVYQEQVQQAAKSLAGFSLGQGDILRKAMGKKDAAEMEKQREAFVAGCRKHSGIPTHKAEKIFEMIHKFAGYGFNKAHSAGYAIIAYQTAYLKAHYPVEFMSANLSNEIGDFEDLPKFICEAGEMDIEILKPDVNRSSARFAPEGGAIRFGLAGIKNVGHGAAEAIVLERERSGPFKGLLDFCRRVDMQKANRKTIETLVKCGAFDSICSNRGRMFAGIDLCMRRAESDNRDRLMGQGNLFAALEGPQSSLDESLPDAPDFHKGEMLAYEKDLLGAYLSGHPLAQHEKLLRRYSIPSTADVLGMDDHAMTRVGGIIARVDKKFTRKEKKPMAVLQMEDMEGAIEAVLFSDAYAEHERLLVVGAAILVGGEVARESERVSIKTHEIIPLSEVPDRFTRHALVRLPSTSAETGFIEKILAVLKSHPGRVPVIICIEYPGGEKVYVDSDRSLAVCPSDRFVHDLERLLGEGSIYLAVDMPPCVKPDNSRYRNGRGRNGAG